MSDARANKRFRPLLLPLCRTVHLQLSCVHAVCCVGLFPIKIVSAYICSQQKLDSVCLDQLAAFIQHMTDLCLSPPPNKRLGPLTSSPESAIAITPVPSSSPSVAPTTQAHGGFAKVVLHSHASATEANPQLEDFIHTAESIADGIDGKTIVQLADIDTIHWKNCCTSSTTPAYSR